MNAESVEGKWLNYILAKPDGFTTDSPFPVVVLLHGFGASMYDLAGLAPAIDSSGYVYAFPNAPYRVQLGGGAVGFSWALGRPGVEAPAPQGPAVEEMLDGFMLELRGATGFEDGRVVLGGFSQGAGVGLRYGLLRPEVFAGLAVLSGFFRDADEIEAKLPAVRSQPLFIAHGRQDPVVAIDMGRQTRSFLEKAGYEPEFHDYDMGHEITPAEIADLQAWLHRLLPPATPG